LDNITTRKRIFLGSDEQQNNSLNDMAVFFIYENVFFYLQVFRFYEIYRTVNLSKNVS